jgi:hypothetical protein
MNEQETVSKIAYCGLFCPLCHKADECDGCKSDHNCCGKYLSEGGCYQYNCCTEKGIQGCWECEQGPCDQDMFSNGHAVRNRVFVKVARQEGLEKLIEYVLRNQEAGIRYGWNKDYDQLDNEEAVIDLLHKGVNSQYAKKR